MVIFKFNQFKYITMERFSHLWKMLFLISFMAFACQCSPIDESRKGLSIFGFVRFQNTACNGTTRNGTCYTSNECSTRGGLPAGDTCASGYGVCCIFTLTCGGTSSENCTYLSKGSDSTSDCSFTICPKHSNICRIRFDFIVFRISDPVSSITNVGGSIGDCTTDSFSITGENGGSPVICGTNSGRHMIVDSIATCNMAQFFFGGGFNNAAFDIKVTQFECGFEDTTLAGPSGCLQYFTGQSGVIENYAFPTSISELVIEGKATHLSSQDYRICIRRETGNCRICYIPTVTGTMSKDSYGLGPSSNGIEAKSLVNEKCKGDFLEILSGIPFTSTNQMTVGAVNKICGRYFNTADDQIVSISVCSFSLPFELRFVTDQDEMTPESGDAVMNENKEEPRGTVGFSLTYKQFPC
ncbi:uncharacterized protein [Lepeophtheirus salmonis]|uniref:uncharacterized protein n=1 Tax=Lepeophtheirus salmonis TaxID=72036 RepID=UPI001AE8EE7A|nr:uncharacterized protein LOC121127970 [Lepeophtheirus salmonis]